ncbi:MAG TPA: YbjQ family protein [Gemmatimonadaceae bacterium]|jgi:uncharacterized protein YbjQ (UPF0145 family)
MAPLPAADFLTTTANSIDGYDVVRTFGIVRGIVVRSRSVFGSIGAALQTLAGGDITLLTQLCERTRADAFAHAMEHAVSLGGNALIAVRYDATEIMRGVSEVLCYGTAVRVAPKLRKQDLEQPQ